MKLQADRPEGVNIINAYTADSVSVNGAVYRQSILVPPIGAVLPWVARAPANLTEADFEQIAQARPELVVLGSGQTLRFAPASVLRPLINARIGIETMDTAAACRTYNILVGEGRKVLAALLVSP